MTFTNEVQNDLVKKAAKDAIDAIERVAAFFDNNPDEMAFKLKAMYALIGGMFIDTCENSPESDLTIASKMTVGLMEAISIGIKFREAHGTFKEKDLSMDDRTCSARSI